MIKRMTALLLILLLSLALPACASAERDDAAGGGAAYTDVPADAWYADAVNTVSGQALMTGTGEGVFSPDAPFTRAQLTTVLYRMAGQPPVDGDDGFSDTDPGAWYADAVLWAKQNNVVNGTGGGLFSPDMPTTQQMLVTMLWRMEGEPSAEAAPDADEYAAAASGWARARGIAPVRGEFVYAPRETATRAQTAALLSAYLTMPKEQSEEQITLTVAGRALDVEWEDNSSVAALKELLKEGDITLLMTDYGGFEKGAPLPEALPENNEQMNTDAGDVILYQGRQFVIYYDKNSWALTPLGKIQGIEKDELKALLGDGDVTAVISLHE